MTVGLIFETGGKPLITVTDKNGTLADYEGFENREIHTIVGFVKTKDWKVFDVDSQTFFSNGHLAVGKYPIFADSSNQNHIGELVKDVLISE